MKILFQTILLAIPLFYLVHARTPEEWRSRRIYQILTDRFARSDGSTEPCPDLGKYCGGTWKGIMNHLDYIQGMGFNAIWISPIQENGPGGYHGYWCSNFYKINGNFGTEQDFKDLVSACHERDIWIMVDVVPNHVSYVQENIKDTTANDYSKIFPFDKTEYFNPFEQTCIDVDKKHQGNNRTALETCWLQWLPDLNQRHPFVRQQLLEWVNWLIQTYHIDGLRVDAVRHIPVDFCKEFQEASGVYNVGELFNDGVAINAEYQQAVGSMLNFPLNARLYHTYVKDAPMSMFAKYYEEAFATWPDITVLTNFMDNHDIPRFLYQRDDMNAFKATLIFTIVSVGIPAVYYGDEQGFRGGDDPQNRETLWGHMKTDSDLYQFIKALNEFREKTNLDKLDQTQRDFDDEFYSFSRGKFFFVFTNSPQMLSKTISNHPYKDGDWLCDFFNPKECIQVENGEFVVVLQNKESRILVPAEFLENQSVVSKAWKNVQGIWNNIANLEVTKLVHNFDPFRSE